MTRLQHGDMTGPELVYYNGMGGKFSFVIKVSRRADCRPLFQVNVNLSSVNKSKFLVSLLQIIINYQFPLIIGGSAGEFRVVGEASRT